MDDFFVTSSKLTFDDDDDDDDDKLILNLSWFYIGSMYVYVVMHGMTTFDF